MLKYEVQNIIPFTDVYYVDCINLVLLTAIRGLNGSISSYIANDYFVYRLVKSENGLRLRLEKQQVKLPNEIAEDNGINIQYSFEFGNDIIDSIIEAIENESMVLLPMDGYYYNHPYHDLFYLKEHHHQFILIYGFDSQKKVFKIVDVNGFEWNTKNFCYKHEMSYQNLVKCHEGIINFDPKMPTLRKYSKDSRSVIVNNDSQFYKNIMINNMKLHKTDILKGLQDILVLADNIEQFDMDDTAAFNNKVASSSNLYKMTNLLGGEYSNTYLIESIVNEWMIIQMLICKNGLNGMIDNKKFSPRLREIHELESRLYEELFTLFDRI